MIEAKKPLKAQLASELSAAADEDERTSIRAEFEARERMMEHEVDFTPRSLDISLAIDYSKFPPLCPSSRAHTSLAHNSPLLLPIDFLSK